jgi:hypothetical protein
VPAKQRAGILGQLGRVLRGGADPSPFPAALPVDLTGYRRRAQELLWRLQGAAEADRLTELGALSVQLTALVEDLRSTGAGDADARPLEELLKDLHALLAKKQPTEKAVAKLWAKAEATLQAFAADATPFAARREGFWK